MHLLIMMLMLLAMLMLIMMQLHLEARSNDRAAAAADALTVPHFQGCMFRDDELDADDADDGYGTHGLGSYTSNIPQSSH